MARNKGIPQVWERYGGGGGSGIGGRYLRDMTDAEIAEREERQKPYQAMLARQHAYEDRLFKHPKQQEQSVVGCTFTKPCKLPDGTFNYVSSSGAIPTGTVKEYGEFALLGGRETDANGNIKLKKSAAVPYPLNPAASCSAQRPWPLLVLHVEVFAPQELARRQEQALLTISKDFPRDYRPRPV